MSNRLRQTLLFVAGCLFASLFMDRFPATPFGTIATATALWLSMYPFAANTTISLTRYWLVLPTGALGAVIARHYSGEYADSLKWVTLALFLVSVIVVTARRFAGKRA